MSVGDESSLRFGTDRYQPTNSTDVGAPRRKTNKQMRGELDRARPEHRECPAWVSSRSCVSDVASIMQT